MEWKEWKEARRLRYGHGDQVGDGSQRGVLAWQRKQGRCRSSARRRVATPSVSEPNDRQPCKLDGPSSQ